MFAHFICALLGFCTRKFPAKSEKKTWTLIVEKWSYAWSLGLITSVPIAINKKKYFPSLNTKTTVIAWGSGSSNKNGT